MSRVFSWKFGDQESFVWIVKGIWLALVFCAFRGTVFLWFLRESGTVSELELVLCYSNELKFERQKLVKVYLLTGTPAPLSIVANSVEEKIKLCVAFALLYLA